MRLSFTRSDLATFALGALAAALVPLGAALAQLDSDPVTDYSTWAMGLLTGIGAALGRYLATAVPQARVTVRPLPEWEADMMRADADLMRASLEAKTAALYEDKLRAALEAPVNRPPRPAAGTVGEIVEKKRQPPVG